MKYRINKIAELCTEYGFSIGRFDQNRIDIQIRDGCVLSFLNIVDEQDTLVGFNGTPWHDHGIVQFMSGPDTYLDCDELDIIIGLISGELLIVSRYLESNLVDRWIMHRNDQLDLKYIEAGEELNVYRLT